MGKKILFALLLLISPNISSTLMAQSYCIPSFQTGCSWGDYIDDFVLEDGLGNVVLNHLGTGCSAGGYGDYSSNSALEIELEAGEDYHFKVTHGESSQIVQIWLDLDGNGSFEDTDELLFRSSRPTSYTSNSTQGIISIPNIRASLSTRLRVKTFYADNANAQSNSCNQSSSFGEVHDYQVNILGENPNCLSPSNLTVDTTVASGVEINWDNVSGATDGYTWQIMKEGENPDLDAPVDSGTLSSGVESLTLSSLNPNVIYDFYLRSECGNDEYSIWQQITFYKASDGADCNNPHEISTLPYSHSDNTENYPNIYSGIAGSNCGGNQDYLSGKEVIYRYTADKDDLLTFTVSNLNDYYAGLFIYDSCEDIGSICAASAVAGASIDDIQVLDFEVEENKTYFIVISSWLASTIEYTLEINSFNCADLEIPQGDVVQEFIAGETVEDLEVVSTRPSGVLTWYSDMGLNNEIIDISSHLLTNGTLYYVTQSIDGCESDPLEIKAEEYACNLLEIVDITEAEVACRGSVTLKAKASGNGEEIFWYDAEVDGNLLKRGETFTTPEITTTTSYWVSEIHGENLDPIKGLGRKTYTSSNSSANGNSGLTFEADEPFTIVDVEVFVTSSGGEITIELQDSSFRTIAQKVVTLPSSPTGAPTSNTISLDFNVPEAGMYYLKKINNGVSLAYESSSPADFPYPLGDVGNITIGTSSNLRLNTYYYFYNWTIAAGEMLCESPRQEVIATVDQSGDLEVKYDDLPYINTNKTSLYGNDYSGDVGTGCVGEGYLNGFETVYYYEAHPSQDNILQIELTDFDNQDAALFIYNSCGNIGVECLAGATVVNGELKIEDYYVEAGEDIIIVISSASGTVDYTLEIDGVECSNVDLPVSDPAPYFASGQTIADLNVQGSLFNQDFKWYSDSDGNNIIQDPSSELLVDGKSIYVTQTILDCESTPLEITPIEFDCTLMYVEVEENVKYVCAPSGTVTLEAQSSGIGSEIFWFDAETEGNIIGKGEEIQVSVGSDRKFWVSETFTNQAGASNAALPDVCKPVFSPGCIAGQYIDDFILSDINEVELITHLGTGCSSTNGYSDYTKSNALTTELIAGSTYNFEVTVGGSNQHLRIWIDFNGDGDFDNNTELLFTSTSAGNSTTPIKGSFKLPNAISGKNAVLRVVTTYGVGYGNSCGSNGLYGEAHDYKVTLIGADVICESPRQEVNVLVNDVVPSAPLVTPMQIICEEAMLSEIKVLGENIRWYNSKGNELEATTPIVKGERYFVTQTVKSCESEMTEIFMEVNDRSEIPVAATNQAYEEGETLADLDVFGENLTWYNDQWKSKKLPETTILQTQTTYYVSQRVKGECESEVLGITAHRKLDVKEALFENFNFYPNPVEEILLISNAENIDEIEIYDVTGRKLFSQKYKDNNLEIDMSIFSTGSYLLKAKIENSEKIFRIIKK